MGIFGHPVGTCDECSTPGIKLYDYNGQKVCAACRKRLRSFEDAPSIEAASQVIHNVIEHANKNYP